METKHKEEREREREMRCVLAYQCTTSEEEGKRKGDEREKPKRETKETPLKVEVIGGG